MKMSTREAQWNAKEPLQLEIYTSWGALEDRRTVWEQLLQNSYGPSIFSTPEWLGAWWGAYGHDKQLLTIAFSNAQGELVGLAPLYLEEVETRLHSRIWCLRLVGDGAHSDNLDVLVRPGQEEACAHALLDWLASNASGWDLCELNTLPADSPIIAPLRTGLRQRGWVQAAAARPNSVVLLPTSWEAYLRQLPSEHANNIVRYTRRLQRHHTVRTCKCVCEQQLPASLEVLFDLHQRRWTARGEPGSFATPTARQFYLDMSRAFLQRGWLEFWLLELDGTNVAAQFAFRYGETVYLLQEGFDPAHASDRVGQVLRAHILQQLIADGVRRYDFLGGTSPHKQSWGAQDGAYTDLHFAKALTRGALYLQVRNGAKAVRQWLQVNAPRPVYSSLRDIYHAVKKR